MAQYASQPESDPWRKQAYKPEGVSVDELIIQEMGASNQAIEWFVVSHYSEGFVQIIRKFDSLHHLASDAEKRIAELDV